MSEPTTQAGRDLLNSIRGAVLDPVTARLLSLEGRPQLVALASLDLLEKDIPAIEAEARAAALAEREAEVERLRVAAAGVLPMLSGHDDCAWEPGTGFECEVARLRAALAETPEAAT